jgi:hypothetical protein
MTLLLALSAVLLLQSNQEGWSWLIHVLIWTPQLLWGIAATRLLVLITRSWHTRRTSRWAVLVPYAMIVGAISLQMRTFGVPPFSPTGGYLGPHYEAFWDCVIPSMVMRVGLVALHVIALFKANTMRQR